MELDTSSQESSRKNLMNLSGVIILYYFVGASIGTPSKEADLSLLGGTFHIGNDGLEKLYVFVMVVHWYFIWRAFTHFKTRHYWSYIKDINTNDVVQLMSHFNWTHLGGGIYKNDIGPSHIGANDQGRGERLKETIEPEASMLPLVEVFPNLAQEISDTRAMISIEPALHAKLRRTAYWRTSLIADNYMFWLIPSVAAVMLNGYAIFYLYKCAT